ncbi:hypothetical protein [Streptacidiphilus melanogenes]|uniref:hypothetical protein n=1 Tax=Streptacidiphilus melanogenes TaxID=411235 RepID=UPI00126A4D4D|nr:hypothetical protein [Streptacidiphilus melanogenes]
MKRTGFVGSINRAATAARWALHAGLGAVLAVAGVTVAAPPAQAGARGCNDRTCIDVDGSGLHVDRITASTTWGGDFTGHFHVYGGGVSTNSTTGFWGYHQHFTVPVGRDLPNRSVLCAEGWEHSDSGYRLRGRACEEVRF